MDFTTQLQIEAAVARLHRAFPYAAMITVSFHFDRFNSGITDARWEIKVGFTNRANIEVNAATIAEAVEEAMPRVAADVINKVRRAL